MNLFTICPNFINFVGDEKNVKYFPILLYFTLDNSDKVSLDSSGKALEHYKTIALKFENIRFWIKILSDLDSSYELIEIDKRKFENIVDLFIEICSNSFGSKNMIVQTKQHYVNYENILHQKNIVLFDKDEIRDKLFGNQGKKIKIKATKGGQISFGDKSSNIKS
jgi:hypothetical protein